MRTEDRPCEDTARRWPSVSQGQRLRQKPGLLTPGSWPCSLQNCEKTALLFTPSAVFRYGSSGKLTQQLLSLNRALRSSSSIHLQAHQVGASSGIQALDKPGLSARCCWHRQRSGKLRAVRSQCPQVSKARASREPCPAFQSCFCLGIQLAAWDILIR